MVTKREPSGEDKLIERFFKPLASHPGALGLSDDAAYLTPPPWHDLVLTADTTVAGVHFLAGDPPDTIAQKALRVNLSDLAAKGAEPVGALLAISFAQDLSEEWIEQFCYGLGKDCKEFACPLLGGDTTRTPGPLSISITAIGKVPSGKMVRRAGAKPGDLVVVSGLIGDGALGLLASRNDARLKGLPVAELDFLIARYRVPSPRMALAPLLRDYANAAMDISDGLVGDLGKLAAVSGVRAEIHSSKVPLSVAAYEALHAVPDLEATALTGGDDYEILAAIPEGLFPAFAEAAGRAGVPVSAIGRFGSGEGVSVLGPDGEPRSFQKTSYSHF